ncbi:hypothetical protein BDY21DRAFT_329159 [Lineolata rhizophorae]|uniref:Phosphoribosylaminoimidazole-succinocarboxamide synthase n=1 Tax=Lineolata rhizophorae TaxID=578093 RepID=A0A6A6NLT9_9PEZI|nr:hypothetical protein BDY21DRAFT_329159 [Lineolata rhizophorae]
MNSNESFSLRNTTVNRPQLAHAESQHSITASEDYYSLSESRSSESDERSQRPGHYATPPSRFRSPQQSHELLQQSQSSLAQSLRPQRRPSRDAAAGPSAPEPAAGTSSEKSLKKQPSPPYLQQAPAASPIPEEHAGQMDPGMSPATTPGVDETPYIRFAIDQLTRDEEIRGTRLYHGLDDEDDYPVDRIIADPAMGYIDVAPPAAQAPPRSEEPPRKSESPVGRDMFVPIDPQVKSLQHPTLNFLPSILRPHMLGLYMFLCLAVLVLLIVSAVWSLRRNGLWDYDGFGGSRYFVFQYLPTLIDTIILVWLFQIQIAVMRIVPFMSMADHSNTARTPGILLDMYPSEFLVPKFQYFRAGQPILGACFVIFWLFPFTIPLLASSYNVRYFTNTSPNLWRWVAVQGVIWTVVVLYVFLIFALVLLCLVIWRRDTGLKWDPRSLADLICMLERSNIMNDYAGSEAFTSKSEFHYRLAHRTDRLGYWHTSKRPRDIFYGIGEPGGATRMYSIEQGKIREKAPEMSFMDLESHPYDDERPDLYSPEVRRGYLPWYLKDTFVVAWITIVFVLLIAFLVVSFVNRAVGRGFLPDVPVATNAGKPTSDRAGFSASNFLYSFVPATIGLLLYLLIQTVDFAFRRLTPFAELSSPRGATAEMSLLLDYPFRLPFSITISAFLNRHYRVALFSFASLLASVLPTLAGGVFWTQYYPPSNTIRVAAQLPGFIALCAFLALYALAVVALLVPSLPSRGARLALPHALTAPAHAVSWLYQSRLLSDRAFREPHTKAELVTRLVGAPVGGPWGRSMVALGMASSSQRNVVKMNEEKRPARKAEEAEALRRPLPARDSLVEPGDVRYGFGVFLGRDGREHLGVDRVRRVGTREMTILDR